ncbi:protein FAM171B [Aplochiton taeniatus]
MPADRPLLLLKLLSLLLISCGDGVERAAAEERPGGLPSTGENNGLPNTTLAAVADASWEPTTTSRLTAEPAVFSLSVAVRDAARRGPLVGVEVSVFHNHSRMAWARTGPRGEAVLRVAYSPGISLTLLATMEGYVPLPLPWSSQRRPVFSSVMVMLQPENHGNLWVFQDSLLITGKLPDVSSQPTVQFPQNLLSLPEDTNVSMVTAYLTTPQRHLDVHCMNCTPALLSTKSGSVSMELRPVAAISVLLSLGGQEVPVRGPIQLSLPLAPGNTRLRPSDTLAAWALNTHTGAWEHQGLGVVKHTAGSLVWTYTASHLGFWVAAPTPSPNDVAGSSSLDYITHHPALLLGLLGATVALVLAFLSVLLCHCTGSEQRSRTRRRRTRSRGGGGGAGRGGGARFSKLTVLKKDQTTSTSHMDQGSAPCTDPGDAPRYNIYVEDPGASRGPHLYHHHHHLGPDVDQGPPASLHYVNAEEVARLRERSDQERFYHQDHLVQLYSQASSDQQGATSNTFPRNSELAPIFEGHAQNHQTRPQATGSAPPQSGQEQAPPPDTPSQGVGAWGRYANLLESSVSVPGTLSEAAGRGRPAELQGLSDKAPPSRAWFVSLDGKPAASVRHSVIELQGQRSRAAPTSNDTSLDSGVDMSELTPAGGGAAAERHTRSLRTSSLPHPGRSAFRYHDDADPSSSESGTTATCTPEDPALRNILGIPEEERDAANHSASSTQEDSQSRDTPPPRRLRKVREKRTTSTGGAEKRSGRGVREGARPPLTKRS